MNFRRAEKTDLDKVSGLYLEMIEYLDNNINYPGWYKNFYPIKQTAEEAEKKRQLFILENNEKIIATCILKSEQDKGYEKGNWKYNVSWNQTIEIHTLFVKVSELGKGYSKILLNKIEDFALSKEISILRLDVYEKNIPAKALYEKQGFVFVGNTSLGLEEYGLKNFLLYEKKINKKES